MGHLGATIRDFRKAYGFSPEQLAAYAELLPSRLMEIEEGEAQPTVSELYRVAAGLAVEPAALRAGASIDPSRSIARFRAPSGAEPLSATDSRLLARGAELGQIIAGLRKLLEQPVAAIVDARQIRGVTPGQAPWKEGYELGERARTRLAPANAPLESVEQWLESQGVHVASVPFDSASIDAASLYEPGSAPIILLNSGSERVASPLARRAILAHELCHILHDGGERDLTVVSRDGDTTPVEQRANAFAPSFLAPRGWVEGRGVDPGEIVANLADDWGLSFGGAVWHAKNLNLISADDAERLAALRNKPRGPGHFEREIARPTPGLAGFDVSASPFTDGLLYELVVQAAEEGVISRNRAREILTFR